LRLLVAVERQKGEWERGWVKRVPERYDVSWKVVKTSIKLVGGGGERERKMKDAFDSRFESL